MKCKAAVFVLMGFVVGLCALITWAQEQEQKAQLYLIWDIQIHPSMLTEYDATTKEMVSLFAKHKFPYPLYAYLLVSPRPFLHTRRKVDWSK